MLTQRTLSIILIVVIFVAGFAVVIKENVVRPIRNAHETDFMPTRITDPGPDPEAVERYGHTPEFVCQAWWCTQGATPLDTDEVELAQAVDEIAPGQGDPAADDDTIEKFARPLDYECYDPLCIIELAQAVDEIAPGQGDPAADDDTIEKFARPLDYECYESHCMGEIIRVGAPDLELA